MPFSIGPYLGGHSNGGTLSATAEHRPSTTRRSDEAERVAEAQRRQAAVREERAAAESAARTAALQSSRDACAARLRDAEGRARVAAAAAADAAAKVRFWPGRIQPDCQRLARPSGFAPSDAK